MTATAALPYIPDTVDGEDSLAICATCSDEMDTCHPAAIAEGGHDYCGPTCYADAIYLNSNIAEREKLVPFVAGLHLVVESEPHYNVPALDKFSADTIQYTVDGETKYLSLADFMAAAGALRDTLNHELQCKWAEKAIDRADDLATQLANMQMTPQYLREILQEQQP